MIYRFKFKTPSTIQDHEWLVDLHNDPLVLYNMTDPTPITLESHLNWWSTLNLQKNPRFIFTVNDENVGFAKVYNVDLNNKNCMLGGDIHKEHRGNGYSYNMWNMLLEYCFNHLNLYRVGLTTAEYNELATKVYKKLGFKSEGFLNESLYRDGVFHNQLCMYLTKPMYLTINNYD